MRLVAREIVDVVGPVRLGGEVVRAGTMHLDRAKQDACVLPSARMGVSLIGRGTCSGRSTACTRRTVS
jgi:hypothetical protein